MAHIKKRKDKKFIAFLLALFICIAISILFFFSRSIYYSKSGPPIIKQPDLMQKNKPTILGKYIFYGSHPDYQYSKYRPRQFHTGIAVDIYPDLQTQVTDAGAYTGWDMLNTPKAPQTIVSKWVTVQLNRPATLAIVWRGGSKLPNWLASWQKGGEVGIAGKRYPTYRNVLRNSEINLSSADNSYVILFAESDGKPSLSPQVPHGKQVPQPNQTCPGWVHDQYKALGPDGKWYPTWHPQIDPVYWCYFNHEHGVNPAEFDKNFKIVFGYAGGKMGMHEAHVGYKVYVWDDQYGYRWLALQHQGTSTNQAACGEYHELDIAAKDKKTGEIVSEQYFVGDYGFSRPIETNTPLNPSACPDQGKNYKGEGVRFLPVQGLGPAVGEPWTVSSKGVIGFNFADFTVTTLDSARACKDMTCDSIVYTGNTGSNHTLGYVRGFGPKSGEGHSGVFYTDPMGQILRTSGASDAVLQYIKPGLAISSNIPYTNLEADCRDLEGTASLMHCGVGQESISAARENSIKVPN